LKYDKDVLNNSEKSSLDWSLDGKYQFTL